MEFQLSPSTETFLLSRQSSRRCREILESCPRGQRLAHSEQTARLTCSGRRSPFQNERLRAIWDGVACALSLKATMREWIGPFMTTWLACGASRASEAGLANGCLAECIVSALDEQFGPLPSSGPFEVSRRWPLPCR